MKRPDVKDFDMQPYGYIGALTKYIDYLDSKTNNDSNLPLQNVIWRCNEDITDLYGNFKFTKGLIYEQVKTDQYPMMLVDNNVEESEVYNLKDSFTSI